MNNDRLEALLWARVDGTIDPQELAELEAHLAEHPESREIERQITTIAEGLDALEKVQPPSELRGRIDSALEHATPPAARTDHSTATPHIRTPRPFLAGTMAAARGEPGDRHRHRLPGTPRHRWVDRPVGGRRDHADATGPDEYRDRSSSISTAAPDTLRVASVPTSWSMSGSRSEIDLASHGCRRRWAGSPREPDQAPKVSPPR